MINSRLKSAFIIVLGAFFLLVSLLGIKLVSSLPFGINSNSEIPVISNAEVIPDEITSKTENVTVRAEVSDTIGISWVRVYPCRIRVNPYSSICLIPVELSEIDDGVWESTVNIKGLKIEVDDEVGFNITAQNELGNQSSVYISKTVLFLSVDSTADTTNPTSTDSPLQRSSSIEFVVVSLSIVLVVSGRILKRLWTSH